MVYSRSINNYFFEVKIMRKFNRPDKIGIQSSLLVFVLVVGLVLTTTYFLSAQQDQGQGRSRQGQGPGGERPQFDPAQMVERMVDRSVEPLNLSADETAVLKPKIKAIFQTRMEQGQQMREVTQSLQTAIGTKDEAQIKAKLAAVKAKRQENKAKIEAMEKDLVELLTLNQEAQLTVSGVVNSDGGGGGFGGGGFGGRGGRPGGNGPQRGNQ